MLLEVRQETEFHFLVGTVILGFLSIFKKSQASSPYESLNLCASRRVKGMWGPLSKWGGHLRLSLASPQGIQTCLHHVRWKTSLNLSHCREIVPSFESGPLGDGSMTSSQRPLGTHQEWAELLLIAKRKNTHHLFWIRVLERTYLWDLCFCYVIFGTVQGSKVLLCW